VVANPEEIEKVEKFMNNKGKRKNRNVVRKKCVI